MTAKGMEPPESDRAGVQHEQKGTCPLRSGQMGAVTAEPIEILLVQVETFKARGD
jgi:hypothetical protein